MNAKGGGIIFDLLIESKSANKSLEQVAAKISALEAKIEGTSNKASQSVGKSTNLLSGLGGKLTGIFAAFSALEVGKEIFDTGLKFEKFQATLTNTLGSAKNARDAMAMLTDVAKKTPFSLAESTDAFIKLNAYGINPTRDEMIGMADLSSTMGKSVNDWVEAVADATQFEGERLKEFGVRMQQNGDKLKMTFRGQTVEIAKTSGAVRQYLAELYKMPGIAGASAAQMQTLGGKLSGIGDQLDMLYAGLMDSNSGFVHFAVDGVASAISWLDKLVNPMNMTQRNIQKEQDELLALKREIEDTNTTQKRRIELMQKAQREHGITIKNINDEAAAYKDVTTALDGAIEKTFQKMALAANQSEIEDFMKDNVKHFQNKAKATSFLTGFHADNAVAWNMAKYRFTDEKGQVDYSGMFHRFATNPEFSKELFANLGIPTETQTYDAKMDKMRTVRSPEYSKFLAMAAMYRDADLSGGASTAITAKMQKAYQDMYQSFGFKSDPLASPTSAGNLTTGGGGGTSNLKDLTGSIAGQKNTTVILNIQQLIRQMIIQGSSLGQTETEIRETVTRILLDAVTDAAAYAEG